MERQPRCGDKTSGLMHKGKLINIGLITMIGKLILLFPAYLLFGCGWTTKGYMIHDHPCENMQRGLGLEFDAGDWVTVDQQWGSVAVYDSKQHGEISVFLKEGKVIKGHNGLIHSHLNSGTSQMIGPYEYEVESSFKN